MAAFWTSVICTPTILSNARPSSWWRSSMELAYDSLVPLADFNAEGVHRLDIIPRLGLDYYVILCLFIIRVVSTIHLQKQFPCKCIIVTLLCIRAPLTQRHYWVVLGGDINLAIWARPGRVDMPVRIFIDDKEYSGVTITPKDIVELSPHSTLKATWERKILCQKRCGGAEKERQGSKHWGRARKVTDDW